MFIQKKPPVIVFMLLALIANFVACAEGDLPGQVTKKPTPTEQPTPEEPEPEETESVFAKVGLSFDFAAADTAAELQILGLDTRIVAASVDLPEAVDCEAVEAALADTSETESADLPKADISCDSTDRTVSLALRETLELGLPVPEDATDEPSLEMWLAKGDYESIVAEIEPASEDGTVATQLSASYVSGATTYALEIHLDLDAFAAELESDAVALSVTEDAAWLVDFDAAELASDLQEALDLCFAAALPGTDTVVLETDGAYACNDAVAAAEDAFAGTLSEDVSE